MSNCCAKESPVCKIWTIKTVQPDDESSLSRNLLFHTGQTNGLYAEATYSRETGADKTIFMKKPPSKVAHNWPPFFFFITGLAAQTSQELIFHIMYKYVSKDY